MSFYFCDMLSSVFCYKQQKQYTAFPESHKEEVKQKEASNGYISSSGEQSFKTKTKPATGNGPEDGQLSQVKETQKNRSSRQIKMWRACLFLIWDDNSWGKGLQKCQPWTHF